MTSDTVRLKESLRSARDNMDENHAVRLHRALSWMRSADEHENEPDIQFISLWIALNTLYGVDEERHASLAEREIFQRFIYKLNQHDTDGAIYNCLWKKFSGPVKALISNQYVFAPFWSAQRAGEGEEVWRERFDKSATTALSFLKHQKVPELLSVVLDRLYVLRIQLMHGGATYQSQVNRQQVTDGAHILSFLMLVIVNIMLDAHEEDWGAIYFPVIKG